MKKQVKETGSIPHNISAWGATPTLSWRYYSCPAATEILRMTPGSLQAPVLSKPGDPVLNWTLPHLC